MSDSQISSLLDQLIASTIDDHAMACARPPQAGRLPSTRGAYILAIQLDQPQLLPLARLGEPELPAGLYVYAGSAYGPGGIKARVTRHLRKEKTVHWHIDHLTKKAAGIGALAFPGANECELVSRLTANDFCAAVDGFGSSDCRTCSSHLLVRK